MSYLEQKRQRESARTHRDLILVSFLATVLLLSGCLARPLDQETFTSRSTPIPLVAFVPAFPDGEVVFEAATAWTPTVGCTNGEPISWTWEESVLRRDFTFAFTDPRGVDWYEVAAEGVLHPSHWQLAGSEPGTFCRGSLNVNYRTHIRARLLTRRNGSSITLATFLGDRRYPGQLAPETRTCIETHWPDGGGFSVYTNCRTYKGYAEIYAYEP